MTAGVEALREKVITALLLPTCPDCREHYDGSRTCDPALTLCGRHDRWRQARCTCEHPGLTYDGPAADCPEHGREGKS